MDKDLIGAEIYSDFKEEKLKYNFFKFCQKGKNKNANVSIIYGRNGSGKSNICKNILRDDTIFHKDKNKVLEKYNKEKIKIYNESFIDRIKIKKQGLDSIVIFGKDVDYDNKISELRLENSNLSKNIEDLDDLKGIEQTKETNYEECIKGKLRGNYNWAGIKSKINGNKQNSSVNETVIKNLIEKYKDKNINKSIDELKKELDEKLINIKNDYSPIKEIDIPKNLSYYDDNYFESLEKLINKKVEKPKITEREKILLDILDQENKAFLNEIVHTFKKDNVNICPFCLRDISNKEKNSAINSVEKILTKKIRDYTVKLKSYKISPLDIKLDDYIEYNFKHVRKCIKLINDINEDIDEYSKKIDKKIENPFIDKKFIIKDISGLFHLLDEELNELLNEIKKFNTMVESIEEEKKIALNINDKIAYLEIKDSYNDITLSKKEINKLIKEKEKLNKKIRDNNNLINKYISKKKKTSIAVEDINKGLSTIFYDKNRLRINSEDDKYLIKVNNKSVRPSELSIGERNAISISYFFTSLIENKNLDDYKKDNLLILLDDPISSFDNNNKIGMLTYIVSKVKDIVNKKENESKIVILTHDISIAYKLNTSFKSFSEITNVCKEIDINKSEDGGCVRKINIEKYSEYSQLLIEMYKFAFLNKDYNQIFIGNTMRRVMEGFTNFLYRNKFTELLSVDDVRFIVENNFKSITNKNSDKCLKFYDDRLFKLVLHGESHKSIDYQNIENLDGTYYLTIEEKRKTCKEVLSLLYLISKDHVIKNLTSNNSSKNRLNKQSIKEDIENYIRSIF